MQQIHANVGECLVSRIWLEGVVSVSGLLPDNLTCVVWYLHESFVEVFDEWIKIVMVGVISNDIYKPGRLKDKQTATCDIECKYFVRILDITTFLY